MWTADTWGDLFPFGIWGEAIYTMDPLASPLDVQERLGRALTTSESLRIEALIRDASAAVRKRSTQHFTLGTSIVFLTRLATGQVRLPQRPIVSVSAVTDINDNALTWSRFNDRVQVALVPLNAWEMEPWRSPITQVKVTYTHGYEDIPDDIIAVVCQIAARALGTPPDQGGITQEGIDGYNYSIGSAAAAGGLGMLATEVEVCDSYRAPAAPISVW